ncbi:ras-associating and dilute domain-containing protein-like isoform X2 [Coregonus clupeaformis]|uniref:ras-associating and dilute domain-containing protein-like isoform X2 n=1 Tax=Coregonus clupeaformis TaxID=59861 RepID=UPI001E1C376C|nr:ras-associating and dilute domain-containing protein-like isoform X2 [Coregonus clupeaformis]
MDSTKMTLDRSPLPPKPNSLHPVGLPACSPKRRFIKLGRKQSDGSSQSGSSGSSTRSADSVGVDVIRQPSRSRIRRHTNRLSAVFQRGSAHNATTIALPGLPGLPSHGRKELKDGISPGDAPMTDDPAELSNQITAPGILKIFGSEICQGANYKSVLATTHSSAKELVKEALERYGLNKEEAESYVLCDSIGYVGDHQWRTECFRVVGDNEKPLLLQSLWKPREGLARRFEIQRRASVEEKRSRDKDTVTAGINAQARKLQKSRSRVTSALIEGRSVYVTSTLERGVCGAQNQKDRGGRVCGGQNQSERGPGLWRSQSEADLSSQSTETQQKHQHNPTEPLSQNPNEFHTPSQDENHNPCHSQNHEQNVERNHKWNPDQNLKHRDEESYVDANVSPLEDPGSETYTEPLCPSPETERERGREREETESSDDNVTLYSIHPPQDYPYLLLLQGYSYRQDFVIYLLNVSSTLIGRCSGEDKERSKVDFLLSAPDILPRHCCLCRHDNNDKGCSTVWLRPFHSAMVTRNGETLSKEAELSPGDVIGMGRHYLFLFKDPTAWVVMQKVKDPTSSPDPTVTAAPGVLPQATTPATSKSALCNTCMAARRESSGTREIRSRRATACLKDPEGRDLNLLYVVEHEETVVKEIVAMGSVHRDKPPLTVAFLLSVCVEHSATHLQTSELRRLLLLIASQFQNAMWEHTNELAASQPEVLCSDPEEQQPLNLAELVSGLRPLVVWMSNAMELLYYIQQQLPQTLAWRSHREQGVEAEGKEHNDKEDEEREEECMALLEMRLSYVRSASEEAMTVLEEVIMLTFQQCVYYLTKTLYPILPSLLDSDPFRGSSGLLLPEENEPFLDSGGVQVPGETDQVLEVLTETSRLLQDCQLHNEISSQLLAYLFYFINASLFNTLMERGSEVEFYQWSRGVHISANLDLLLDWAQGSGSGLGDLVVEHLHTLSSAVNLLATPREQLMQSSWESLRCAFPSLSPAQLHHLLRGYSPATPWPPHWAPSDEDQLATQNTADILESFDSHPPLVLPSSGFSLGLRGEVTDSGLAGQLRRLQEFISNLSVKESPGNITHTHTQQDSAVPMEAKLTKMATLPKASLEFFDSPPAEKVLPLASLSSPSPPSPHSQLSMPSPLHPPPSPPLQSPSPPSDLNSCGALLTQKLKSLELKFRETDLSPLTQRRSALDPSCLLTPPNTPHSLELVDPETEHREDEEEDEEVFTLELQRGDRGLGLALVDARDTALKLSGILIRAVVPDSPAARCERLGPGDRILAVNGVSLLGLDYTSGKELIQSSGDRLRLLVARSEWRAITKVSI